VTGLRAWRLVVPVAGSVTVALLAPALAWGAGKTYQVVQCDPLNRGLSGMSLQDGPAYAVKPMCGDPHNDHAIKITNLRFAMNGRLGRVSWYTGSSALRIVGTDVEAWLRRDKGHAPRLFVADAEGHEVARVAAGQNRPSEFRHYSWHSTTARPEKFVAQLRCERLDGCPQSGIAKTWLRKVHLTVADRADPTLEQPTGPLLYPGWVRGQRGFDVRGNDVGSGIQRIFLTVNGSLVGVASGYCTGVLGTAVAEDFRPCQSRRELGTSLSTARMPFHDGRNEISACVVDFALNRGCIDRTVQVDNTPPVVAFTNAQDPNDPELIRAQVSDATSGVTGGHIYYRPVGSGAWRPLDTQFGSGELRARANSTVDPPGRYEFMAVATDAAGNWALSTKHADGRPMVLTFPLKSGVRLRGHLRGAASHLTVGYGQPSKASGTLTNAEGEPLADQQVTVTEFFGDGALIDRRIRTLTTNAQGHWTERLPGGPSRGIVASYAGTRRYLPDGTRVGRLQVKTKATLRLSRSKVKEGHRVAFKGRVGHLAARIPAGGKLAELEVKNGKNWQTVQHPFYTRPDGKFKLHYRFARFYTSNVRYRFRVRVLREHDWPYKAPTSSRVRQLVVKAR
jgi:hypothetical protein